MDFRLTDEQRLIKETARELAEAEFADAAFTWEGEFPAPNVERLAEQGLLGIALPEAHGGGGYTPVEVLLAAEAVGRVCPDTAHVLSRSSMGPPRAVAELGSEELKARYLPGVAAGETVFAIAISEAGAGSDAAAMTTTAERDGDEYVINGEKLWITKAHLADAFLVYAKFDGDVGAVVVDADADGLTVVDEFENMAGGRQPALRFDDCAVPAEHALAVGRDAFKRLLTEFNVERCHNAMMCVACGLNAFDKAIEHVETREQFGQPIAEFQGVGWKLADMAIRLDAARLLVYRAAADAVHDEPSRLDTSMAKVMANEVGGYVVDEALQLHGATGYMKGHPLEYLYRLVRGWKIAGGTVEVQRDAIAGQLRKYGLD